MFTGIIEAVGRVSELEPLHGGRRLSIEAPFASELSSGDSVAVDGVCLTVVATSPGRFTVDAIGTTLSRTCIGRLAPGARVNLERALALGGRIGGHLVQGHVDGTGEVVAIQAQGEHVLVDVRVPAVVADTIVPHGSIALNGVSMTVNATPAADVVQVAVIPFTWQHTTFADRRVGDVMNLEGDMIGKFVVAYLRRIGPGAVPRGAEPTGGSQDAVD